MSLTLLPREPDEVGGGGFGSFGGSGGSGDDSGAGEAAAVAVGQPRASQACVACKRQKRKCDKGLPVCGLCRRMSRPCEYAESQAPAPTADDLASLQLRLAELEERLNQHAAPGVAASAARTNSRDPMWLSALSKFPSAVFLDIDCFKWAGLPIPKPPVDIPLEVLEVLSDGDGVQQAATEYFATVHLWFPIVSKKRMHLGLPLWDGGPDLAMLFLAMRLITSRPSPAWTAAAAAQGMTTPGPAGGFHASAADNPLYLQSKRFLALLETSGTVSLLYLQAMLLVALYEYGHAIYPAAWMTIGACARYCDVLGLPSYSDSVGVLGQCTTWTEAEERRRVWWGVFVLDRVISLGSKRRCSAAEPVDTDVLPVDDAAWDEGNMAQAFQRSVSAPLAEPAGPFARLCQVCILIGRAIAHCQAVQRSHRVRGAPTIDVGQVASLTDALFRLCSAIDADLDTVAVAHRSHAAAAEEDDPDGGGGGSHREGRTRALNTYLALVSPRCLVWSALVMVFDMYSCPENLRDGPGTAMDCIKTDEEMVLQTQAVEGMLKVSDRIRVSGRDLLAVLASSPPSAASSPSPPPPLVPLASPTPHHPHHLTPHYSYPPRHPLHPGTAPSAGPADSLTGRSVDHVSVFVLDSLYCALAVFHWLWKESGDLAMERNLADIVEILSTLSPRWHLAEEYLGLQKHHDVTNIMALRAGM